MANQVITEAGRKAIADKFTGQNSTLTLDKCKVFLFNQQVNPSPDRGVADLPQATFDGYAPSSAIVWDKTLIFPGSLASVQGDSKEFLCNGTNNTDTIYGAFLGMNQAGNGTTPDTVLAIESFDVPVGIAAVGHGLRYTPHFEYP